MSDPAQTVHPRLAQWLMIGTVLLLLFMLATAVVDLEFHKRLAEEDGFVEWLTVIGLLSVSAVLVSRWWGFRQNQGYAWSIVMLGTALLFVFGAGEELSWGQRIFGWGSELDLSANRQNELNLHNMEVGGLNMNKVIFTYGLGLGLGFYLAVLPALAKRYVGLRRWLTDLGIPVSSYQVSAWFLVCLIIVLLIPWTKKWETLEVVVPMTALVILLMRGAVGKGLREAC